MALITEAFTGTEAIGTTEWSLTTDTAGPDTETSDGEFQLYLDVSDMIAGDELQIRLYEKVRSGDTQRVVEQWSLVGAQARPVWASPKFMLLHGWDWTLDAIAGTITVLWSIRKIDTASQASVDTIDDFLDTEIADIQSRLPAALVSGRIDASVGAMAANVITAAATAADFTTEVTSGLATAAALDAVDNFLDTEVAAILAAVDTEVAAIKAVTDALPDAGALTSLATQASVNTIDDLLDTEVAAIKTVVDAVKAKTDSLTFTVAGKADANITHVIGAAIQENGATDTEWGGPP